jgi:hypothetical protein
VKGAARIVTVREVNAMATERESSNRRRLRQVRRAVLCALTLATGAWLLARGLAAESVRLPWPEAWRLAGEAARWLPPVAAATGAGLLVTAAGLSDGQAWGWLLGAALALLALAVTVLVWIHAGRPDWAVLALCFVMVLALAAPSVREDFLGADRS